MSPRWGLGLWEHTCYTNAAPLGLGQWLIHVPTQMSPRWGLGLWEHTCYTNAAPPGLGQWLIHVPTQMPPRWGLGLWEHTCYTNAAPPGLKTTHSPHILRDDTIEVPDRQRFPIARNTPIFLKLTPMVRFPNRTKQSTNTNRVASTTRFYRKSHFFIFLKTPIGKLTISLLLCIMQLGN